MENILYTKKEKEWRRKKKEKEVLLQKEKEARERQWKYAINLDNVARKCWYIILQNVKDYPLTRSDFEWACSSEIENILHQEIKEDFMPRFLKDAQSLHPSKKDLFSIEAKEQKEVLEKLQEKGQEKISATLRTKKEK